METFGGSRSWSAAAQDGMDINSDSEDDIAPASAEKENAAATSGTLGPCKSQQGYAAAAAAWPSGTAAWVSRKSLFFPVVTGGY